MTDKQGDRVKELRLFLKMNQTKFAESIGITQGAVWQIEKNKGVSMDTLMKISAAHKVSISWLLEGTGEMLTKPEANTEAKVFLSAPTLYAMWQESEAERKKDKATMTGVIISLTDQLAVMKKLVETKVN